MTMFSNASFYKIISTTLSPNMLSPSIPAQSLLISVFRGYWTKNWDFHKGDTLFEAVQHEKSILQSASVFLMKSFFPKAMVGHFTQLAIFCERTNEPTALFGKVSVAGSLF